MTAELKNSSGEGLTVKAKITVGEDGVVKGEIEGVEGNSPNPPEKGEKFSFKTKVAKGTLTISEMEGTGGDAAKQLVEGDYKKKKKEAN
jgi:hypothetical protein